MRQNPSHNGERTVYRAVWTEKASALHILVLPENGSTRPMAWLKPAWYGRCWHRRHGKFRISKPLSICRTTGAWNEALPARATVQSPFAPQRAHLNTGTCHNCHWLSATICCRALITIQQIQGLMVSQSPPHSPLVTVHRWRTKASYN